MDYSFEMEEHIPTMFPIPNELKSFEKIIERSISSLDQYGLLKLQIPADYLCKIDEYFSKSTITSTVVQTTSGGYIKKVNEETIPNFDHNIWARCSQPYSFLRVPIIRDARYLIDSIRESSQVQLGTFVTNEALSNQEGLFWVNYTRFTPVIGKLSTDFNEMRSNLLFENIGVDSSVSNILLESNCFLSSFAVIKPWKVFTNDTFDIYYHYYGAPIQWYIIRDEDRDTFITYLRDNNKEDAEDCNAFFRHHAYLCSPIELAAAGILVRRHLQKSGEIFVFKPGEIYMGFHHGFTITQEKFIENSFFKFDSEHTLSGFCSCGLSKEIKKNDYELQTNTTEEPPKINNFQELYELLIDHPTTVPVSYKNEIISAKELVQIYQKSSKVDIPELNSSCPNSTFTSTAPVMITPTPSSENRVIPDMKLLIDTKEMKESNPFEECNFIDRFAGISPIVNGLTPWTIDINNLDHLPTAVQQYVTTAEPKLVSGEIGIKVEQEVTKKPRKLSKKTKRITTAKLDKSVYSVSTSEGNEECTVTKKIAKASGPRKSNNRLKQHEIKQSRDIKKKLKKVRPLLEKKSTRKVKRRITDILKLEKKYFKFKIGRIPINRRIHNGSTFPKERKFRLEPQPDSSLVLLPCELFLPEEEIEKLEKDLVPFSSTVEHVGGSIIYHCDRCDQTYQTQHHLLRHQKSVHSKTKPYCCPHCLKGFKRKDHVTQHLRRKIPCKQSTFEIKE